MAAQSSKTKTPHKLIYHFRPQRQQRHLDGCPSLLVRGWVVKPITKPHTAPRCRARLRVEGGESFLGAPVKDVLD